MSEFIPQADATDEAPALTIGRTAREIRDSVPENPDWLVPGMVAVGMTTELNGREKSGKGYFSFYLIGALERRGETVFGPSSLDGPTRALIYTEEPLQSLKEKLDLFDVSEALVIYHWELAEYTWIEKMNLLTQIAVDHGFGLVFIDNISAATATEDENGVELARHVEPLSAKAKELGLAVLYDRHQRKGHGDVRDRARGGTALAGAVDVIVAMDMDNPSSPTERKLDSWGRLWDTNWKRRVRLVESHDDYEQLEGADWKEGILLKRGEWTIKDFVEASGMSSTSVDDYLNNHPLVTRAGKRGKEILYRVAPQPAAPSLD